MLLRDVVKLDQPVVFSPFINNGGYSQLIDNGQKFIMSADDVQPFIDELVELSELDIIEQTRQALAQRADGTLLQTAFPDLPEFKAVIVKMKSVPKQLLELVDEWEVSGANEVMIDFEEKPHSF